MVTIATAAIFINDEIWTLPRPARHHVIQRAWALAHGGGGAILLRLPSHVQGFVTSEGAFVDRFEAARIALKSGQIKALKFQSGELFSEDLW